jgi:hypothetical protein
MVLLHRPTLLEISHLVGTKVQRTRVMELWSLTAKPTEVPTKDVASQRLSSGLVAKVAVADPVR